MQAAAAKHPHLAVVNTSLQPTRKQKPPKHSIVHDMTPSHVKELKTKLVEEREKILLEHPSSRMIGIDFVCPDIVIDKICEQIKIFFLS